MPVDHTTFVTRFENVYAVGDATSAPVPRVGAIAEGEARTLAEVITHQIKGGTAPRALQPHRDLLHRVRRCEGGTLRRQLPFGPQALRNLRRSVRGDRCVEG